MESTTSSIFTLFPELPTELRLEIWHHVAHIPRIVHLFIPFNYEYEICVTSPPPYIPPPAILAVNRESRSEALFSYTVIKDVVKTPFFFNHRVDTLYVDSSGNPHACQKFLREIAEKYPDDKVRRLAFSDPHFACICFADAVGTCTELEEFWFVGQMKPGASRKDSVYTYQEKDREVVERVMTEEVEVEGGTREGQGGERVRKNLFFCRESHKALVRDFNRKKYAWLKGKKIVVKAVQADYWREMGLSLVE